MTQTTDLTVKRDNLKNKLGYAGIGLAAIAAGIFYMFLIQAVAGILALGIAGALGFTMVQLAPWFALKIANLRYRMIDAEKVEHVKKVVDAAKQNPIETLTNLLAAKRLAFDDFKENVTVAATARDTFKTKVKGFAEKYPHRAPEFQTQLDRMSDLVEQKKRALQQAKTSLEDGDLKLEEMKAYWEMSQAAQEANRAAGMDTGDLFEKLKADTACDAVFDSMNRAFAELEIAASLDVDKVDAAPQPAVQLGHSAPNVLEVAVTQVKEQVVVK